MASVVTKEQKELLEAIPDMDWGAEIGTKPPPATAKPAEAEKAKRGRPIGSKSKPEKPKVKIGLNNAALKQAVEVGGILPLVVVDKVGFIATKGKYRLLSKVPPQSIAECQQTFAQAVGLVELEMTPWQAYGFTLVGAILGGVLAFATEALQEAEKRTIQKQAEKKNGAPNANGATPSGGFAGQPAPVENYLTPSGESPAA